MPLASLEFPLENWLAKKERFARACATSSLSSASVKTSDGAAMPRERGAAE
jgi:hypothetical protein